MPFLSPLLSFFGTGLGKVALALVAATAALVVFLTVVRVHDDAIRTADAAAATIASKDATISGLERSVAANAADAKTAHARDDTTTGIITRFVNVPSTCGPDPDLGVVFDELQRRAAAGQHPPGHI